MKQKNFKIILVEPKGEINVGSIARLCENYGIEELRIVNPKCNINSEITKKMAVKGRDLLREAKIYDNFLNALEGIDYVIATSGRTEKGSTKLCDFEEIKCWMKKVNIGKNLSLVFGRECNGLKNEELNLCNKVITINTPSTYKSLNISHAVAIILHELFQSNIPETRSILGESQVTPFELEHCIKDSEKLLTEIGFLLPHTAKSRMNKIRSILLRSEATENDIAIIRGIINQFRWALESKIYNHHDKKK